MQQDKCDKWKWTRDLRSKVSSENEEIFTSWFPWRLVCVFLCCCDICYGSGCCSASARTPALFKEGETGSLDHSNLNESSAIISNPQLHKRLESGGELQASVYSEVPNRQPRVFMISLWCAFYGCFWHSGMFTKGHTHLFCVCVCVCVFGGDFPSMSSQHHHFCWKGLFWRENCALISSGLLQSLLWDFMRERSVMVSRRQDTRLLCAGSQRWLVPVNPEAYQQEKDAVARVHLCSLILRVWVCVSVWVCVWVLAAFFLCCYWALSLSSTEALCLHADSLRAPPPFLQIFTPVHFSWPWKSI